MTGQGSAGPLVMVVSGGMVSTDQLRLAVLPVLPAASVTMTSNRCGPCPRLL